MAILVPLLTSAALPGRAVAAPGAQPATPVLLVTGAVTKPLTLTTDDLRGFPQHRERVTFATDGGRESHTYTGARLLDVMTAAGPRTDPAVKNPKLGLAVAATGADGYTATVSWGEFDPDFAGTDVLVALTQDHRALTRPRLVVPGDAKGGRYVRDLVQLELVDVASAGSAH
jgi:DMSO/TMAO reductase YedYZ molybdopterin-dependent catalytic subunit